MIKLTSKGSFAKTDSFLRRATKGGMFNSLEAYGQMGVNALAAATPQATGKTASSWAYKVTRGRRGASIEWFNTNEVDGVNIAIIIHYGHGTGTGGFVRGRRYINKAIQPVFDRIADEVWKKVTS